MTTLSLSLLFVLFQLSWSVSTSVPTPSSHHLCLPNHRDALLQFKNSISSDICFYEDFSHPRTETWNKSIDCCTWDGVECDNLTGHVIGINLTESCLEGPLSANNALFHLDTLRWLDLSANFRLSGSILDNTSGFFHLHRLRRLDLSINTFNGTISSELFTQMSSLTHLNLAGNEFTGLIPHQIGLLSNLVSLDLSSTDLRFDAQGFDMLATNSTKLTNLVLDELYMSDVAPASFQNLSSSLQHLSLSLCQLHGEFPSRVFRLPVLKHLDLGFNDNLTGYLPKTNLSRSLELLELFRCSFRGSIPSSFGDLTQIISIGLQKNQFQGEIPDVFGNLTKLTSLRLSFCNLSGPIPLTLFNLTRLTHLDLSNNHLEGPLPNHVSQLQLLEKLDLSINSIRGGLPSWLLTLPSLIRLDLSHNKLAGPIHLFQKPGSDLQYVDLSSNDLDGPIPDSVFDSVNLTELFLSSNNLSGVVKSDVLSKLTSLEVLDVSNNSLLSLSTSGNIDVNNSFPQLQRVFFSGCSVRQFPSFFRTSKLEILDLSNNKITGGISKWEAQGWERLLVLNLSYNSLTTLEQFPGKNLEILDLRSNLLQGPILSTLDQSWLEVLLISENKLTGNIPPCICNSSALVLLDLSENNLSGIIPECLGNSSTKLQFMGLQMNNLSGKIPASICTNHLWFDDHQLGYLFLNDNQLDGLLPPSLANCSNLKLLNLGNNKLTDTFPHWLASLPYLEILILKSNRFHGSLPHSIAFSALRILDLSGNEFSGTLPKALFRNLRSMKGQPKQSSSSLSIEKPGDFGMDYDHYQLSVNVTTKRLELQLTKTLDIFVSIDLSNNQFCGQIPEEVGQLISLRMLNFSHNNFTGHIPASFGNLVALESLDLSSNRLGGRIPSQMTDLTFLEVLNLSENHLVGPIPHGKQFDTFDNDSYIGGNLGLCGLPLSKQCSDHGGAKPPAPSVVEHEGNALSFFWKAAMMGYGSGVVLGISLGYIVFTTGRPWWFVKMVETHLQYNLTNWIRRRNRPKRN